MVPLPGAVTLPPDPGGGEGVTVHGDLDGLTEDDHPQYALLSGARPFTGPVAVPDLKITGESPEAGLVWTAEDTLGNGSWQEPSSLVVAETSDPVLINWFDLSAEGWKQFSGLGTMAWMEMDSPSMPGVLDCVGDVWAEWQASGPMVFEPGALYRMTVRARMDKTAKLSFGFQCYNSDTPAVVVDRDNSNNPLLPHGVAVDLLPGDAAWEDDVLKPGQWLSWTGYLSGKTAGAAENLVPPNPVPEKWPPEQPLNQAPAEFAVKAAANTSQWRPVFHAVDGHVWIDAIEVHRLDRSLELPGGIRVSDVYAQSVTAESVTTENLKLSPPPIPEPPPDPLPTYAWRLLTAVDEAGTAEWKKPPIQVSEGPPVAAPESPYTLNVGTVAGRQGCMVHVIQSTVTITALTVWTRVPGSRAVQFTLDQPAMVTARLNAYMRQTANTNAYLYLGVGVTDEANNPVYTDDWEGVTAGGTHGQAYLRATTAGDLTLEGFTQWKRYLQPGTYTVFPRAYLSSVDAASTKQVSNGMLELEIDPTMTYLTGQRP